MTRACLLTLMLIGAGTHAADLGTWGDLYPITEPNMLTTIHDRLNAMQESCIFRPIMNTNSDST